MKTVKTFLRYQFTKPHNYDSAWIDVSRIMNVMIVLAGLALLYLPR